MKIKELKEAIDKIWDMNVSQEELKTLTESTKYFQLIDSGDYMHNFVRLYGQNCKYLGAIPQVIYDEEDNAIDNVIVLSYKGVKQLPKIRREEDIYSYLPTPRKNLMDFLFGNPLKDLWEVNPQRSIQEVKDLLKKVVKKYTEVEALPYGFIVKNHSEYVIIPRNYIIKDGVYAPSLIEIELMIYSQQ
jgi:hypothetical protein